ncbi:MAG: hypothetical protein ABIZ91_05190 [Gemmatimonadaceae bacterium]
MADVFKIVFLVLGTMLVLVSYWLATTALFPSWVDRTRAVYADKPVRATLIGVVIGVPAGVAGVALTANAPSVALKVVGALFVSLPVLLALAGSSGFALRIGVGLAMPHDAQTPWRRVLRGGAVLALCFLLPLVGWFVVLPWTLVSGVGAALLSMRRERAPSAATVEVAG